MPQLESLGVSEYVLESRGPSRDKQDVALLLSLRAKGLCKEIDLAHASGDKDAHLWVPDQVLGAYGEARTQTGTAKVREAWSSLRPRVSVQEVPL